MNISSFHDLLSTEGQELLALLQDSDLNEENILRYITDLRKNYSRELVEAAIETALLRRKARTKFTRADQMYFTREALEQASGEQVSTYRSERYLPYPIIADLACGIGGDTISLAGQSQVLAIDNDPLRLAMAQENARVYAASDRVEFQEMDLNDFSPSKVDAIFFDPSRRIEGRRIPSVKDYSPPLAIIDKWLATTPAVGVKISPAVRYEEISWDCEIEFISLKGELKEAVLWFGPLKTAFRRATILPSRTTLIESSLPCTIPVSSPLAYLYEPDPAVIRSHLVETLAEQLDASKVDQDIAYLTSNVASDTPLAQRYQVQEVMPFNLKKLNERLRSLDVGRVVVKKRGSPIEPQELQKKLKLTGSQEIVVVLTHLAGKPGIILCR